MGFANSHKQGDTTKKGIGIYRWVEEPKKRWIEFRNINPVVWSEQNQERLVMNMTTTDSVYHQGARDLVASRFWFIVFNIYWLVVYLPLGKI